jgi:hypothetical protein
MNSTRLKKNEGSDERTHSPCLLAHTTSSGQNPSRHTRHDSKSSKQQYTTVNFDEQTGYLKSSTRGDGWRYTTEKVGTHERED